MTDSTPKETPRRRTLARLWLTARWAVLAGLALVILAGVAMTPTGSARVGAAIATWQGKAAPPEPEVPAPVLAELDALNQQSARLVRAIHALTTDRERLLARIDALEAALGDVTGSVAKLSERPEPTSALSTAARPSPVPPAFILLEPALGLARPPITEAASERAWAGVPLPRPAQRSQVLHSQAPRAEQVLHTGSVPQRERVARAEPAPQAQPRQQQDQRRVPYGVDLGSAPTIDGVRALWMNVRTRSSALATLAPAVAASDQQQDGHPQLRLVAGPLPSAGAAARLCQALSSGRTACRPVLYQGQPLALR